jgi:primary-amine oxidase
MTYLLEKADKQQKSIEFVHPLEPLSVEEIKVAVATVKGVKQAQLLSDRTRFMSVALQEPPKDCVLAYNPGDSIDRQAFMVLLDNETAKTYEVIVSVTKQSIVSWKHIPDVQPGFVLDEFFDCEAAVKASPAFQAALLKRGITDLDLVMVDPWSAGNYGLEDEEGVRLSRALSWVRSSPTDNGYARPIEGVIAVVDLNAMAVVRIDDYGDDSGDDSGNDSGVVPLPPQAGNYSPEFVKNYREDLKPLEIVQPEGASFQVNGHEICWQKWKMRIGFTPREGLVLYTVSYEDEGKARPILYRASLVEMTVPYGDPRPQNFRKNAFDVGEYGLGMLTHSLKLGCDCLGEIYYFDGIITNSSGEVAVIENAICLHEEDFGIL